MSFSRFPRAARYYPHPRCVRVDATRRGTDVNQWVLASVLSSQTRSAHMQHASINSHKPPVEFLIVLLKRSFRFVLAHAQRLVKRPVQGLTLPRAERNGEATSTPSELDVGGGRALAALGASVLHVPRARIYRIYRGGNEGDIWWGLKTAVFFSRLTAGALGRIGRVTYLPFVLPSLPGRVRSDPLTVYVLERLWCCAARRLALLSAGKSPFFCQTQEGDGRTAGCLKNQDIGAAGCSQQSLSSSSSR